MRVTLKWTSIFSRRGAETLGVTKCCRKQISSVSVDHLALRRLVFFIFKLKILIIDIPVWTWLYYNLVLNNLWTRSRKWSSQGVQSWRYICRDNFICNMIISLTTICKQKTIDFLLVCYQLRCVHWLLWVSACNFVVFLKSV